MVGGGWLRLAVVSCGVSWEREKDDAEGWGGYLAVGEGCSHAAGAADFEYMAAAFCRLSRDRGFKTTCWIKGK